MTELIPPGCAGPQRRRGDRLEVAAYLGVILLMHVVGFAVLVMVIAPAHLSVGTQVFGVGLGLTAYVFGLRHAFDADHIAAIDNTTRALLSRGRKPKGVGFWFALGHSTVVFALAALIAVGAHLALTLADRDSSLSQTMGLIGTSVSGVFLYIIGLLNLVALIGIAKVLKGLRSGRFDEAALEHHLDNRGLIARLLRPLSKSIKHSWQMFPIGLLFGLGFDTATEIALLVLAGSSAVAGLPWYAILVLPLLFAAGMSLLDFLDGLFMSAAYDWAFARPIRKIYYNLSVTGLSVAVALIIGTVELVGVLHDNLDIHGPVIDDLAALDLNNVGFVIVGLFVVVWAGAIAYWHLAKVEERWKPSLPEQA